LEDLLDEVRELAERKNAGRFGMEDFATVIALDALKEQYDVLSKDKDHMTTLFHQQLDQMQQEITRLQGVNQQQQRTIDRLQHQQEEQFGLTADDALTALEQSSMIVDGGVTTVSEDAMSTTDDGGSHTNEYDDHDDDDDYDAISFGEVGDLSARSTQTAPLAPPSSSSTSMTTRQQRSPPSSAFRRGGGRSLSPTGFGSGSRSRSSSGGGLRRGGGGRLRRGRGGGGRGPGLDRSISMSALSVGSSGSNGDYHFQSFTTKLHPLPPTLSPPTTTTTLSNKRRFQQQQQQQQHPYLNDEKVSEDEEEEEDDDRVLESGDELPVELRTSMKHLVESIHRISDEMDDEKSADGLNDDFERYSLDRQLSHQYARKDQQQEQASSQFDKQRFRRQSLQVQQIRYASMDEETRKKQQGRLSRFL